MDIFIIYELSIIKVELPNWFRFWMNYDIGRVELTDNAKKTIYSLLQWKWQKKDNRLLTYIKAETHIFAHTFRQKKPLN